MENESLSADPTKSRESARGATQGKYVTLSKGQ